jgi:hypothetical protein
MRQTSVTRVTRRISVTQVIQRIFLGMDCHLERSEAPAERSRKTPLMCGSREKHIYLSTTNAGYWRVHHPHLALFPR